MMVLICTLVRTTSALVLHLGHGAAGPPVNGRRRSGGHVKEHPGASGGVNGTRARGDHRHVVVVDVWQLRRRWRGVHGHELLVGEVGVGRLAELVREAGRLGLAVGGVDVAHVARVHPQPAPLLLGRGVGPVVRRLPPLEPPPHGAIALAAGASVGRCQRAGVKEDGYQQQEEEDAWQWQLGALGQERGRHG
uniref:Uncharacterized protein n=1 Tax=Arundo donax TaxID=35708 RepID=A0A0A9CZZ7_ARUDO